MPSTVAITIICGHFFGEWPWLVLAQGIVFIYFIGKNSQKSEAFVQAQQLAMEARTSMIQNQVNLQLKQLEESKEVIRNQQQTLVESAKNAALGEMAGQIAHEINTPLGAVVLTTQAMLKKVQTQGIPPQEMSEKLELILKIAARLGRIISSMRKLSAQGGNEAIREVSFKGLIDDTLLLCEGRLRNSNINFTSQIELAENATVQCRPSEVSQVLLNLINNAVDALKNIDEKWIRLQVSARAEIVTVRIIDSGTGVALEHQAKLFTPNFTTKSLDIGTGFGLSICRKLIEKHGGKISLEPGVNTTFAFELPLRQTEAITNNLTRAVG